MANIDTELVRPSEILVIEDKPATVKALSQNLERRDVRVELVGSREFAEEPLRTTKLAAILIDLNIPGSDGDEPSAEVGHQLVVDICEGALGKVNRDTPVAVITAQKIGVGRSMELKRYRNFLGFESKIRSHDRLIRKLVDLGVVRTLDDIDGWSRTSRRERLQVVVTDVGRNSVSAHAPDLSIDSFSLPMSSFSPKLQKQLAHARMPLALWAIGNVAAEKAEELQLREFTVSREQIKHGRDYTKVSWLSAGSE